MAISAYTPPAFDAPLGGSRPNIATPFGLEKLEWCGYPMVKNFEDTFIRFDMIHERDRRTDRQTPHDDIASHSAAKIIRQIANELPVVSAGAWLQ